MTLDEPPYDPEYDEPRGRVTTRLPPQDADAERALIGAAMADAAIIDKLTGTLAAGDFWRPAHETVWAALTALHAAGHPTDPIALANHLTVTGELRGVGGQPYLVDLFSAPMADSAGIAPDFYADLIVKAARLRAVDQAGVRLQQLANSPGGPNDIDQVLGDALQVVEDATMRFGTTVGPSTWASMDLTDVLAGGEIDPPPELLARDDGQRLLYAGAVHTISGEPGSGKTWLTLVATLQELQDGNTVTMIDFEDRASRVVGRLLGLGATPAQIRERFRYVRPHAALDTGSRADLEHAIGGTTLVILDGVTEAMTLHGLDLSANPDIAKFYAMLPRWIADRGPAVVMIDHVVKDTESQGRWAIGGQHKLAGLDGVAYVVKAIEPFGRGKVGHARISVSKDRPGYIEEIALGRSVAELWLDARDVNVLRHDLKTPTAITTDDAGQMRPTMYMERVSRWLEINQGANKNTVLENVRGKAGYVRQALALLISEGYVQASSGPNRQQIHTVTNPFREAEEETLL